MEHTGVPGFRFPIRSEGEIERLEVAVRSDMYKWDNYIAFLRDLRANDLHTPIRCIFQSVFYDEALVNYNYNGISTAPGVHKRPMKSYAIFRDCFAVAWREFGITDDMIRAMLTEIIKNINRRKRNRQYKNRIQKKKRLQNSFGTNTISNVRWIVKPKKKSAPSAAQRRSSEHVRQPDSRIVSKVAESIPDFRFPIESDNDIERLEETVRSCTLTRRRYIDCLRQIKDSSENASIESIFKMFFYDESLTKYNYNGFSNSCRAKKRAMKNYDIFTNCFLEAWMDYGVTKDEVRLMLCKVIRNVHGRNRFRRYKNRKREQEMKEDCIYLEEDDL
ncbi:uncharacterized protein LOC115264256 [Aedes albopictus]|uniref:DUF4806 domain-containing protein n=1 Tax=Aedes albopictus TaxID=7160 RepID=A0ABM1Y6W9_AEDAL